MKLYGKMGIWNVGGIFLKNEKALDDQIFQGVCMLPMPSLKKQRESSSRDKEKNQILSGIF